MSLPEHQGCSQSRTLTIDFHHCTTIKKPGRTVGEQDWKNYKEQQRKLKLSKQGSNRLKQLRDTLDKQGARDVQLVASVDDSYKNGEVLKQLPERTTLIGCNRKDIKLYTFPHEQPSSGRKRFYGDRLPTPEQIRQSDQYPWLEVNAWAAGKEHKFNVKVIKNVRWRSAGQKRNLQLVAIRLLG